MAEAYALSNAVEHGLRTRAIIVDMRGRLNIGQWDKTASAAMGHCESLFARWISPNTKQVDNKRLAIELSALNQLIWDVTFVTKKSMDRREIILVGSTRPGCCQIASTKTMTSGRLTETLSTDIFDMRPTEESLAIQAKSRK